MRELDAITAQLVGDDANAVWCGDLPCGRLK